MISVLHASLEYKKGVGGIKAVLVGLLPAQMRKRDLAVTVITPFYDVYLEFYRDQEIEFLDTIAHIYKGKRFVSKIFRVITEVVDDKPIYHYMISPGTNSPVAWLFNIKDEKNLYQPFPYSEPGNRIEYFVSAVASLVRIGIKDFPEFDIFHAHAWHTGLAGCLMKEFENLDYQQLIPDASQQLRKIPYFISTVHMLTAAEHGQLTTAAAVKAFLQSVGLPLDIIYKFPGHRKSIHENYLKRVVFALLYADMVSMVSKGIVTEVTNGQAAGLEKIFDDLAKQDRLCGITNGINVGQWDATKTSNLQDLAFTPNSVPINISKKNIKELLAATYTKLDPSKIWFLFVGRFAQEKGMDMLLPALEAINEIGANFIIMGVHVSNIISEGKQIPRYQELMETIKQQDNVVVIEDPNEQKEFGKKFRAATEYMLVLSHNEACGLVSMEGLANAALTVGPKIQGVPDSVRPIENNFLTGTGFLYSDDLETRNTNLQTAIKSANAYYQARIADGTLNSLLARLLITAQEFDWDTTPAIEYKQMYSNVLQRPLLTYDQIRSTSDSVFLTQFSGLTTSTHRGKIFQLGFNKCGSQTIHNFFCVNGIRCLHYGDKNGSIARKIHANYLAGEALIGPEYDQFYGFFDMEDPYAEPPIYIAPLLFKQLDQQHPGSYFILNTRTKVNWLSSRCAHTDQTNGIKYLDVLCQRYKLSPAKLIARWSQEWDDHHAAVLEYFKDRPQDLLVYNIETDQPQKICDFFADRFNLDPKLFSHLNKTPDPNRITLEITG